jgi:hypothetical protein
MSAPTPQLYTQDPEIVARRFFDSLRAGRLVDALEMLAPDAVVSDGLGPDRHGLREITASLIPYRTPCRFEADRIETHGATVSAFVRIPGELGKATRKYQARVHVRAGRICEVRFRLA